jgi:hypothetical protein
MDRGILFCHSRSPPEVCARRPASALLARPSWRTNRTSAFLYALAPGLSRSRSRLPARTFAPAHPTSPAAAHEHHRPMRAQRSETRPHATARAHRLRTFHHPSPCRRRASRLRPAPRARAARSTRTTPRTTRIDAGSSNTRFSPSTFPAPTGAGRAAMRAPTEPFSPVRAGALTATPPSPAHSSHQPRHFAPCIPRRHIRLDVDLVFLFSSNPHVPDVRPILARTPRTPATLRRGADADMEALAGRRRVHEGEAAARVALRWRRRRAPRLGAGRGGPWRG